MARVQVGDPAPQFDVTSHEGDRLTLSSFRGKKPLVIFFYPRNNTPVCTKEACSFRDGFEDFVDAGVVVIGVSGDSNDSHREFAKSQRLPFPLVSDEKGTLRKAFGVRKTLGFMPGRVTYVIDCAGIVRHIFSAQFAAKKHMQEALAIVRGLEVNTG